jgi:hypothetical protein
MAAVSGLTMEDLALQHGELLPQRAALALVNIVNITAVNIALAINAATINSQANAFAGQAIFAAQH